MTNQARGGYDCPPGWEQIRLKWLFRPSAEADRSNEEVLSVYREYGVIPKSSRSDNFNVTPENLDRYLFVRPGDLVVNRMKAWQGSLGISQHQGIVSGDYEVLRPKRDLVSRFLHHLLRSTVLVGEYRVRSTGIRPSQWRLYWEQMGNIVVSLPCADEQRRIADLLDRETLQIDALIAKQQQLMAYLRKRRIAIIASETLRGIDPLHVPCETTVPFAPLGYGYLVTLGKMLDAARNAKSTEQVLPYIRAANIQDEGLRLDDVNSMSFSASEARSLNLRAGDVLVVEGGAVGTAIALADDMPGWSFQKTVNRLRPIGDWDSRFIAYVLRAYRDAGVIDVVCNKSTIPHLTAEKLRSLRVPAPPAVEQRRIADYLDEQTAKIDALIAKAEEFVALARERRAALITEAVTGRINVSTGKMREVA